MNGNLFQVGNRVRVTGYSPFRGLKGTIKTVDTIDYSDEPFPFYLIDLEGASIQEPVWFESEEVEFISAQEVEYLTH